MNISVGAKTDVGLVRDHNEDSFCVNTKNRIFIAADGMGGHAAGEVASNHLKDYIEEFLIKGAPGEDLAEILQNAVQKANRRIYDMGLADPSKRGMGTTATILVLLDDEYYIAQVGDSRAYLHRNGELTQITRDHSKVFQLYEQGIIEKDDIEKHPFSNIITRSIGNHFSVEADIYRGKTQVGDRFLLCSDGLTGELRDAELAQLLERYSLPQECCEQLVRKAIACGGKDNITCVIVMFVEEDDLERKTRPLIREDLDRRRKELDERKAARASVDQPIPLVINTEVPSPPLARSEPRPSPKKTGESEKRPGSITQVRQIRPMPDGVPDSANDQSPDEVEAFTAPEEKKSGSKNLFIGIIVIAIIIGLVWFFSSPATGRLEISTTPINAEIYLDGRFVGKTPLALQKVASGRHELSIALDRYHTEETVIVVRADRLNKKEVRLRAQ